MKKIENKTILIDQSSKIPNNTIYFTIQTINCRSMEYSKRTEITKWIQEQMKDNIDLLG